MLTKITEGFSQINFAYQQPDQAILQLADARPAPAIRLKSDASLGVMMYRNAYKSIEELSAPEMKLAGLRIDPNTNSPSRQTLFSRITILDVATQQEFAIDNLPEIGQFSNFTWSNDQSWMAFTHLDQDGLQLWVLNLSTRKAKQLTESNLNGNLGNAITWAKDNKHILVNTLIKNRKALLESHESIPKGPIISENDGQKAQNRTYQDLLKNQYDEDNFENLVTSEITQVDLNGNISPFAPAAMYAGLSFSPDGKYILVSKIQRPFSYLVNLDRFPSTVELWDASGDFIKTVTTVPLQEELPKGFMAVRKGPRGIQWRTDNPASLFWVEALDDGDPAIETETRDALYTWAAPFIAPPSLMAKTKERFAGVQWGNEHVAVLYESWWNTRNARTLFFDPSKANDQPKLFHEQDQQDHYADLGEFALKKNEYNLNVLDLTNGHFTLIGEGFSDKGKFPFIDQYNLVTYEKNRIFEASDHHTLENLVSAVDVKKGLYLTRLESKTEYPNYFIRDIANNNLKPVTNHLNPFKVLNEVHKEVIHYKRHDGLSLSATMYLPVGYNLDRKEKMPMIMWAYPTEYKDKLSASQVTSNANEFTYPFYGSPIYWLTKGYVVLDDVSFPIVGEGKNEPNDTYISQLVANAKAAIDAVDSLGFIDRSRVAVGGHSYGAFMTANLLTHSDLFAAGVARSGAYNRTLTPFGFQSEERHYWEAPEVYDAMSPFQNADKMKTPLLLIHGEEDNNSGTFPMQSERYFNALKGLGATTRLVILPKESHGYSARESILHVLWEQDRWFEKYLKAKENNP